MRSSPPRLTLPALVTAHVPPPLRADHLDADDLLVQLVRLLVETEAEREFLAVLTCWWG